MRVLAFDCAGGQCAAALLVDGRVSGARQIMAERGHAQALVPLLADLVGEAGIGFGGIDRIAVTTGPGSFTGIRVALAAAHGLALALKVPIVGITVFEAIAAAAVAARGISTSRLVVAVESRRAECFVQLFDKSGQPFGAAAMLAPPDLAAWAGTEPLSLAGDAATRIAPYFPAETPILPLRQVDAVILARLAAARQPGDPPAPFYFRAADAVPSRAMAAWT